MTNEMKAYDMGRFQRLVGGESERASGMFRTLSMKDDRNETLVWPIDLTLWMGEEGYRRRWGRTYGPDDFSAKVKDGVVELDPQRVPATKRAEVEEVLEELKALILAVSQAACYQETDPALPGTDKENPA